MNFLTYSFRNSLSGPQKSFFIHLLELGITGLIAAFFSGVFFGFFAGEVSLSCAVSSGAVLFVAISLRFYINLLNNLIEIYTSDNNYLRRPIYYELPYSPSTISTFNPGSTSPDFCMLQLNSIARLPTQGSDLASVAYPDPSITKIKKVLRVNGLMAFSILHLQLHLPVYLKTKSSKYFRHTETIFSGNPYQLY